MDILVADGWTVWLLGAGLHGTPGMDADCDGGRDGGAGLFGVAGSAVWMPGWRWGCCIGCPAGMMVTVLVAVCECCVRSHVFAAPSHWVVAGWMLLRKGDVGMVVVVHCAVQVYGASVQRRGGMVVLVGYTRC